MLVTGELLPAQGRGWCGASPGNLAVLLAAGATGGSAAGWCVV